MLWGRLLILSVVQVAPGEETSACQRGLRFGDLVAFMVSGTPSSHGSRGVISTVPVTPS